MALANLCTNPINQPKLFRERSIPRLLSLARGPPPPDGSNLPQNMIDAGFVTDDLPTRRYAVAALTNLACDHNTHATLSQTDTVPLMYFLAFHDDNDLRNSALFFLANMASNQASHATLAQQSGFVEHILTLLQEAVDPKNFNSRPKTASKKVRQRSVSRDRSPISTSRKASAGEPQTFGAPHLTSIIFGRLSAYQRDTIRRIVSILRGLSVSDSFRGLIVKQGGMELLLDLARMPDPDLQHEALAALCNLSLRCDSKYSFKRKKGENSNPTQSKNI